MPKEFNAADSNAPEYPSALPVVNRASGSAGSSKAIRSITLEPPPDPLMPKPPPDQVEVKLDYAIDPERPTTHYRVETYFFIPRSLGIDVHTYSRNEFYADMHAYIRFREPRIPSAVLSNPNDSASPLYHARELIRQTNGRLETLSQKKLSHELRLFGCIVRTNLRDVAIDMHDKIQRLDSLDAHAVLADDVRQAIERLLHDVDIQLGALREMRAEFFQPKRPLWLSELFEYVDEYIGISAENCLTSVLLQFDARPDLKDNQADLRERLVAHIVAEQRHRKSAGYEQSVINPEGENRAHVHRENALKNFMSSVLFLNIRRMEEGRGITHITAGIAAAVAMTFSTTAAIWSQAAYSVNSFPFVLAVVIGYVFKDRIKEWLRTYFRALLARRIYDYSVQIQEPSTGMILGRCRESFEFLPASQVPAEIIGYRHGDSTSVLEPETKPEVVMKYIKDVTLRAKPIAKLGRGFHDIRDINRFNIARLLLNRMSEPREIVATYSQERDKVVGVPCPMTYHVNLVVLRTVDQRPMTVDRYRLVLDKRGVKSFKSVDIRPPNSVRGK